MFFTRSSAHLHNPVHMGIVMLLLQESQTDVAPADYNNAHAAKIRGSPGLVLWRGYHDCELPVRQGGRLAASYG